MIPAIASNPNFNTIVVSTGNILNNEIGRKSNEELYDGLKLTLESEGDTEEKVEFNETAGEVMRATRELTLKLTENDRPDISIGVKLFVNKISKHGIDRAFGTLLKVLNVESIDNIVLAYHPNPSPALTTPSTPKTPCTDSENSTAAAGNPFSWSGRNSMQAITDLKDLYSILEEFALQKQVSQLGVCDLDAATLAELYNSARVPPTLAQINLAACCVVPQELKEFCNSHDIQLLTHGDPELLISDEQMESLLPEYSVDWSLRYQVHVRCRGVLTAKGYLLGASKHLLRNAK